MPDKDGSEAKRRNLRAQICRMSTEIATKRNTESRKYVLVEDSRTYRLLRPVLSHHIVVDTLLQVTRVELGNPESGLVEHWASAIVDGGIVAAGKSGSKVLRSPVIGATLNRGGREVTTGYSAGSRATGAHVAKADSSARDHGARVGRRRNSIVGVAVISARTCLAR